MAKHTDDTTLTISLSEARHMAIGTPSMTGAVIRNWLEDRFKEAVAELDKGSIENTYINIEVAIEDYYDSIAGPEI